MNYLTNWFYNVNVNDNVNDTYKPCMLDQGKLWNNRQYDREIALKSNISNIEGFTSNNINNSQIHESTTLSDDFDRKIERYNTEQPIFIDETRNFMKLNDRNINSYDKFNDVTYEKEGCYKKRMEADASLIYQPDLADVNVQTCKMRASDLAYAGFALKKNATGQLGCYLTNDIAVVKTGDLATKTMSSFSFKKSNSATMGGLLPNGQVGIYNNNLDNNLLTDLIAREGCDMKGGNMLINDKTLVATYGGNC
jgi:hypothetical protein